MRGGREDKSRVIQVDHTLRSFFLKCEGDGVTEISIYTIKTHYEVLY